MTKNQIEYNRLLETNRANLANEVLTGQRDAETARANKARESIQRDTLTEQSRHNQSVERETERSNFAREGLTRASISETQRSNLVNERRMEASAVEKALVDRRTAAASEMQALASQSQAATAAYRADTYYSEAQVAAAARAAELELARTRLNVEQALRSRELTERERANLEQERIKLLDVENTLRVQLGNLSVRAYEAETARTGTEAHAESDKASADLTQKKSDTYWMSLITDALGSASDVLRALK